MEKVCCRCIGVLGEETVQWASPRQKPMRALQDPPELRERHITILPLLKATHIKTIQEPILSPKIKGVVTLFAHVLHDYTVKSNLFFSIYATSFIVHFRLLSISVSWSYHILAYVLKGDHEGINEQYKRQSYSRANLITVIID